MPDFVSWIKDKVKRKASTNWKWILYLKGGDLTEELKDFPKATQYDLADFRRWIFWNKESGACTVEVYELEFLFLFYIENP
jgi:hypothetical protein